jgi:hypothetical protein
MRAGEVMGEQAGLKLVGELELTREYVSLHSVTRPSDLKRTKRISQPVRFASGLPYMADRESRGL